MSPGRRRSSSAESSPGALPMWHMTRAPRTPERSQARIARLSGSRPFVHISSIGLSGFPVGEMLNIDYADVDLAAKTLAENPELVLGIKVRETVEVVGANGLEPLKRAILACERSGVRGARVMCHIGNAPG